MLVTVIAQKLQQMVELNKTRINYLETFQQMITEYNADSRNVQIFFNDLINFAQELVLKIKERSLSQIPKSNQLG
ncbi:hypothetical protein [Fortiea contorta]|uniref:hypothetical protein n=1 Tax=Fortiea contorta TaxID=1892405 RepID=UPI00037FBDBF|nr:hypothetical protein [Fortiea contorta]